VASGDAQRRSAQVVLSHGPGSRPGEAEIPTPTSHDPVWDARVPSGKRPFRISMAMQLPRVIERAAYTSSAPRENMRVDHRRIHILVPK
jgi:hypothetical protein